MTILNEMLANAKKRAEKHLTYDEANMFVGGEVFEQVWKITHNDTELAKALLQEMAAVLADVNEGRTSPEDCCKAVIDNLKEYHEELFEESEGE